MNSIAAINYNSAFASTISGLGVVVHLVLLVITIRHRSQLLARESNIGYAILIMILACIAQGLLMIVANLLYLLQLRASYYGEIGPFDLHLHSYLNNQIPPILGVIGYMTLGLLFLGNLLLAGERWFVVHHNRPLPYAIITAAVVFYLMNIALFIGAFAIPQTAPNGFGFLPFIQPCTNYDMNTQACIMDSTKPSTILFILGLLYFPIVCLIICILYATAYIHVGRILSLQSHEEGGEGHYDDDENYTHQQPAAAAAAQAKAQAAAAAAAAAKEKKLIQKSVLTRCIYFTTGLLVFYIPTITFQFMAIGDPIGVTTRMIENGFLVLTILPCLDIWWSGVAVLVFHVEFRDAFLRDCGRLLGWVFGGSVCSGSSSSGVGGGGGGTRGWRLVLGNRRVGRTEDDDDLDSGEKETVQLNR
ncbi:hypothetical protein BDR26DRAFT_1010141 [Obelidium mucronatum]|nr:hypothetical protein BDR26DRAFT_1010141 [Obelidium mucronatum]